MGIGINNSISPFLSIYAASIPFTQRSSFFPLSLRRALSGADRLFTRCGAGVAVYLLYR